MFSDKVVVITGAGGVICSSLAQSISQCGAKVALLDLQMVNHSYSFESSF